MQHDPTLKLQEGIHDQDSTPNFFALLLLRARDGATAASVHELLVELWEMYAGLKRGIVRDLPDADDPPTGRFYALLGLGAKAFTLDGARSGPQALKGYSFAPPGTDASPIVAGSAIPYATGLVTNPADVAVAVQFTGETPLAVERPVVETVKTLLSHGDTPLEVATVYTGAHREDKRSWIDFHDGTSNLRKKRRPTVIRIGKKELPPGQDAWTYSGSYLAFIRLSIDLAVWQRLDRPRQEELVGRDKITGCPIIVDSPLSGPAGCPVPGTHIMDATNPFREAPSTPGSVLKDSHIQRVNHHFDRPALPSSLRIYRQGYPFLEGCDGAPGYRIGLNFVSFQGTPARLIAMLAGHNWLGGVNFGGVGQAGPPLVTAYAAGMFFVPPVREGAMFPDRSFLVLPSA